ncbi:MAG: leucine-rich repeat protein, partial [Salinivirgaceae bacterium]|nr:leucine-rich repeat protein [Salinivirgaceae bacterium]
IGKDAFYYCTALASIDISSAESIGEYAFYNCSSLTSISIPLTATNIDNHAFSGCSALTSVTIPQGIESISYGMFGSCTSLASIEIPSSVTSIGGYAFYSCSSLATVAIPQGIESIDDGTFFDCTSLSSIEIPSSVTSIGVNAFASTALTSIVIPSSVTSISSWVFSGCENLKEVHFKNNTPIQNVHEDAFSGSTNNLTFYVPKGSADVYKNMSWASGHTVYEEDPLSQNMLYIEGDEVSRAIENSHVFIDGRTVTISNLYVSDHEVTQGEFNNVMLNNPSAHTGENLDNYPVENVTWYAAIAYCNKLSKLKGLDSAYTVNDKNGNITDWENFDYSKLPAEGESWIVVLDITKNGYRLPTEAEWEYLARGGSLLSTDTYSGSSTIGDVAWHGGNSGDNGGSDNPQTHEVKTKSPNALGIYDMSGNVWEWCWDWFGTIDTNTPATGVETGTVHVLRGGSFFNNVDNDEPANDELSVYYTDGLQNNPPRYGFRVVRTVTQP